MATLQVRDMDDGLYNLLRKTADREKRSISQEVIWIIQNYLSDVKHRRNNINELLTITWDSDETPEETINSIREARTGNKRFGGADGVFD
ncbi:antitoxin [Myxococcota bacterium]|nr:antitoxin [Myxococcota bacterium]MBU1382743.1 antitoxin [Myxococcota bacterium]MBU1498279.1 antitoxin [Myxococcota bacterium]